ncbi:MAG: MraY family glycosyltransferase [Planctomycetota bacterium]
MTIVALLLLALAFAISFPLTALVRRLSLRLNALDSPGSPGHVKVLRPVPNTGGIAIFIALALPIALGLLAVYVIPQPTLVAQVPALADHLAGIRERTPLALAVLACMTILHLVGVIDDRRALPAGFKAIAMGVCALVIPIIDRDTRLLTLLDPHVGGSWLSIALTVLWIVAVINAMNFMDNMDALCAGVCVIAGSCFLASALLQGQWFVAASLALLIGSVAGFLVWNAPPARIFMGDGGALVIGFLLGFLTVRTTYVPHSLDEPHAAADAALYVARAGGWYGVFMPLVVLAVPMYDIASVIVVRLSLGKSPFVASPHHLSHRLVSYGLSKSDAVGIIYGLTAITGLAGILLGSVEAWQAIVVAALVLVLLLTLAMFEWRRRPV